MKIRLKNYLLRPETGAGLLFAAVAIGTLKIWAAHLLRGLSPGIGVTDVVGAMLGGVNATFYWWTVVSFLLACFLGFILLRRHPDRRRLKRILLVAAAHAVGAIRFHDLGMTVLSVLPLFALVPALLMPRPD